MKKNMDKQHAALTRASARKAGKLARVNRRRNKILRRGA